MQPKIDEGKIDLLDEQFQKMFFIQRTIFLLSVFNIKIQWSASQ